LEICQQKLILKSAQKRMGYPLLQGNRKVRSQCTFFYHHSTIIRQTSQMTHQYSLNPNLIHKILLEHSDENWTTATGWPVLPIHALWNRNGYDLALNKWHQL
jgi:hypothetical protein